VVAGQGYPTATEQEISLYVHIPFCAARCAYCDFYSNSAVSSEVRETVIHRTLDDIQAALTLFPGVCVPTVYVGGGTPSALAPDLFRTFIEGVSRLVAGGENTRLTEWSVEMNPESATEEKIDICADAGVTRLSVGVQSFSGKSLAAMGRSVSASDTRAGVERVLRRWKGALSVDLIAGVPGQRIEEAVSDAEIAAGYGVSHVSLYALTVEPGTQLARALGTGSAPALDSDQAAACWDSAAEVLVQRGLTRYEVSNFARPGRECRHNLRYWRGKHYLGVGPGAVSTLDALWMERAGVQAGRSTGGAPTKGAHVQAVRLSMPRNLSVYAARPSFFAGTKREELDGRTLLFERIMLGLRTRDGLDMSEAPLSGAEKGRLLSFFSHAAGEGLVTMRGRRVCLTPRGFDVMDTLLVRVLEGPLALS